MSRRKRLIMATAGLAAAFLAGMFVTPDFYPALNTYGVSVGTNTAYCSIDLVGARLDAACEQAH